MGNVWLDISGGKCLAGYIWREMSGWIYLAGNSLVLDVHMSYVHLIVSDSGVSGIIIQGLLIHYLLACFGIVVVHCIVWE